MINSRCDFQLVNNENEIKKFGFGGANNEGTIDIYDDRFTIYKKSKTVNLMFGMIGNLAQGKGKPEVELTANDILSMECDNLGYYRVKLKDGRFLLLRCSNKAAKDALEIIFERAKNIGTPSEKAAVQSVKPTTLVKETAQPVKPTPVIKETVQPVKPTPVIKETAQPVKQAPAVEEKTKPLVTADKPASDYNYYDDTKPLQVVWITNIGKNDEEAVKILKTYTSCNASAYTVVQNAKKMPVSVEVKDVKAFVEKIYLIGGSVKAKMTAEPAKPVEAVREAKPVKIVEAVKEAEPVKALEAAKAVNKETDVKTSHKAAFEYITCSNCGGETPKGAFCMNCGTKMPVACPSCGTELPDKAKFCFVCGTKIK